MGDGDAGDFQVHGADSDSEFLKLVKQRCRFLIEGKRLPLGEQINLFLQSRIDRDLLLRFIGAVEKCQPIAKVPFEGDDGRKWGHCSRFHNNFEFLHRFGAADDFEQAAGGEFFH